MYLQESDTRRSRLSRSPEVTVSSPFVFSCLMSNRLRTTAKAVEVNYLTQIEGKQDTHDVNPNFSVSIFIFL